MWDKYPFIKEEMTALENYIIEQFPKKSVFLDGVSQSVVNSGGKRLRPVLAILSSMFGSYSRDKVFPVAAAIETLHAATLVHDDIIDNAETRRGMPSVSAKHGINLAVYTGDYMLVKSILMLTEAGLPPEKMRGVAQALEAMCLGEVEQYMGRHKIPTTREYLRRITRKTGILLSASCAMGAYSSGCSDNHVKLLGRFGMYFGTAFQIRDDLLDIESDTPEVGKPVVNDLKEGVITIPVICAASRNELVKKQLKNYFNGIGDVKNLISAILDAGGAADARKLKERYIEKCLNLLQHFPETEHRQALEEVVLWMWDDSTQPVPV